MNIKVLPNLEKGIFPLRRKDESFFLGKVMPLLDINLDYYEGISSQLKFYQNQQSEIIKKPVNNHGFINQLIFKQDAFSQNLVVSAEQLLFENKKVYYVITDLNKVMGSKPSIYGYAAYKNNKRKKCIEMIHLFNSKYYEKSEKFKVSLVGDALLCWGIYLNKILNENSNNLAIYGYFPLSSGKGFYKQWGCEFKWIFGTKVVLSKQNAELGLQRYYDKFK